MTHHLLVDRSPRLHELVRNFVGLNDVRAQGGKHFAHNRLTRRQCRRSDQPSARQACSAARAGMREPLRILAALTVFAISMAMVSGPTPPGTGVIAPRDFRRLGMNVANQRRAFCPEALFPLGVAREQPFELRGIGHLVHAHVNHRGSGLHEVARNHSRPADGGHQNVGAAANAGKVSSLRVTDGHRGVAR